MKIEIIKYVLIGGVALVILGFRGCIFALMGVAAYDMWKFLKKNP